MGLRLTTIMFLSFVFVQVAFMQASIAQVPSVDVKIERQKAQAQLNGVLQSIDTLIAADNTCQVQYDCKVVVVGKYACGVVASYVTISRTSGNLAAVQTLAQLAVDTRLGISKKYDRMNICLTPTVPSTQCHNNVCILVGEQH